MFFDGDNYFGMVPEITPAKLTKKPKITRRAVCRVRLRWI
ncbi:phage major tail tube protein [Pseudescherichia sp. L3]|nr:phage major tail tube protein [Pseudescherichia sp. L3]MCR4457900.1 phage major tail tube protein [Pseudescherichia sp. L3]